MPGVNELIMAWRGPGDDQRIFTSSLADVPGSTWVPQSLILCANLNPATSTGPSLIEFQGHTCMAWKGQENDNNIFFASSEDAINYTE
jgi:hypothetical protein